jgi:2-haloacid dehalogenase
MPLTWVLFDLNGTLVDPSVLAQPLGDSGPDEELVQAALDDAIAQAMVATLTGRLPPFRELMEAAIRRRLRLRGRDEDAAATALELLGSMPAFIETPAALETLRGQGIRLAVISQSAAADCDAVLRFAGLRDRLDLVMSAQEAGAYKPDPRPYRMAVERMGAEPDDVCFVASHWWDVEGAKRAGMRTGWVARRELALLESVATPDVTGRDLLEVAEAIVASMVR